VTLLRRAFRWRFPPDRPPHNRSDRDAEFKHPIVGNSKRYAEELELKQTQPEVACRPRKGQAADSKEDEEAPKDAAFDILSS
jgi:hypothetical protein